VPTYKHATYAPTVHIASCHAPGNWQLAEHMPIKASDDKTAARLKPGAVIKSKPKGKSKASHVPPLWASSLGTVIDHLSDRHTHEFVKTICSDSKMRSLLTGELLRRAKHGPELGDSDVVEIVLLYVYVRESPSGHHDGPLEVQHVLKYWKVGDLPYRLKAGLKKQFKVRCANDAKVSRDCSVGNVQMDGRLEFELSGKDYGLQALEDAYIEHLHDLCFEECIPAREDLPSQEGAWDGDAVDIHDVSHGVQPETCLWDAWELNVNDAEDALREDFSEATAEIFDDDTNYGDPLPGHFVTAPGKASLEAVWTRKPRVRFVLRP
jgi:hypothetical protein